VATQVRVATGVAMEEEEQEEQAVSEGQGPGQAVEELVAWVPERIARHVVLVVEVEGGQVPCRMWAAVRVPTLKRLPTSMLARGEISMLCAPGEISPASLRVAAS